MISKLIITIFICIILTSCNNKNTNNIYYYYQLSSKEQFLYDNINKALLSFEDKVSFDGKIYSLQELQDVRDAYYLDHPEAFYIDYNLTEITDKYLTLNYLFDKKDVYEFYKSIPKFVTAEECYYYIKDGIDYSYSKHGHNMFGVFTDRVAVCEGKAKAFKYLMDNINVPCIIVCNDNHAWNYIYYENNWIPVDTTSNLSFTDYTEDLILEYCTLSIENSKKFLLPTISTDLIDK